MIENIAGDWISLESITLKGAQSSRYQLASLAMQDATTGETIAWIYDTRSHWKSDRDGVEPTKFQGVTVDVPMNVASASGDGASFTVEWWDTRAGTVLGRQTVSPREGLVRLTIPPFTRDVGLRVFPAR
jgi:hypothetical protein